MKSHAFHAEAQAEFEFEVRFHEIQRAGYGPRFYAAIMAAIRQACQFPAAGAPERDGVRKLVARGFPFLIYYEFLENRVVVWAVMHAARKPGYWQHRRSSPPPA